MIRKSISILPRRHHNHNSSHLWLPGSGIHHFSVVDTTSNISSSIVNTGVRLSHGSAHRNTENKDTMALSKSQMLSPSIFNHRIPILPSRISPQTLTHTSNSLANHFFVTGRSFHSSKRIMSTQKKDTKLADKSGGFGNKSIIATLLASTVLAGYIISPENIDQMRSSSHEYNEVEVEDDVYKQMQEVSAEVRGEITRSILGKELADMIEAEHKAAGNTADVVADVLNSEALQNAIASLITRVVSSEQFHNACQTLLKNLWADLVNDPETLAQIIALLNTAIKDEKIKKSVKELVLGLLQDEDVYNELTGLVVKLGEDAEVLDATKELLTESAHQALNDPEILDHSMEFATDIVGDNVIQRTSGEALRNTVTYAVRPSLSAFLSIFGVALLLFSASALGQARMAAGQGKEIDAAVSVVAKRFGESAWKSISKILSMPSNGAAAIGSAISNILLSPFNLVGALFTKIVEKGNTMIDAAQALLYTALSSPGMVGQALKNSLITMSGSMSNALHGLLNYLASLPEVFLIQTRSGLVKLGSSVASATGSASRTIYASLTLHLSEILGLCRTGLKSGLVRSSTSFDIIFKNIATQGRRQIIAFNYTSDKIVAEIIATLNQLLGRNKADSTP